MDENEEKQSIRNVIESWILATEAGDLDRVLALMAEDVVFLVPGRPPMRGRQSYVEASRSNANFKIEGRPEIQEIKILGDHAYCWIHLTITITPIDGGRAPVRRAGPVLSIYRKEAAGHWVLCRDANLLMVVS